MAKQTAKTVTAEVARDAILDHFGDVRNVRAVLDAPASLGECINSLGLDALSKKGLLKLAEAIEAARKRSFDEMPEDELAEMEELIAAGRISDPRA